MEFSNELREVSVQNIIRNVEIRETRPEFDFQASK